MTRVATCFERKMFQSVTYPKSFTFIVTLPDRVHTPSKKAFWREVSADIFFIFGDTILIQNLQNIESKFLIDL